MSKLRVHIVLHNLKRKTMADYEKVVEMLGENFASMLRLAVKFFIEWAIEPKSFFQILHHEKKENILGLIAGTHEIKAKEVEPLLEKPTANPVKAVLKVLPSQFSSFEEIVKVGNFNNGYYQHLETNRKCKDAILATISVTSEEELVLYWEGEDQVISGGSDIYAYFAEKGYEVVEKAHPSLLFNVMSQLTEEKLTEMGVPSYANIVLPTSEDSLFPSEVGGQCFLRVSRGGGYRELSLVKFGGGWLHSCAFLLRKKKV